MPEAAVPSPAATFGFVRPMRGTLGEGLVPVVGHLSSAEWLAQLRLGESHWVAAIEGREKCSWIL